MLWSLQVLRFVAALMVVYYHSSVTAFRATGSYGLLPPSERFMGLAGVDIFFVLSGVIIVRTARGQTWREFAWRRFRRVLPTYWLVALLCSPAMAEWSYYSYWRNFIATVFLWPATNEMTAPLLGPAWTLCFEMLFYIAMTIVLINKKFVTILIGVFFAAFTLRKNGPLFQFIGNPIIIEFFLGAMLALAPSCKRAVWCLPIGVMGLVAVSLSGFIVSGGGADALIGVDNLKRVLLFGIPSALIVLGTMQISVKQNIWTVLGDSSYILYLVHDLVVSFLLLFWSIYTIPAGMIDLIGMAASVLFAWRLHVRLEIPLLQYLGRRPPRFSQYQIRGAGNS